MENIVQLVLIVLVVFLVISYIDVTFILKEERGMRKRVRASVAVLIATVVGGYFAINVGIVDKPQVEAFTGNPDF